MTDEPVDLAATPERPRPRPRGPALLAGILLALLAARTVAIGAAMASEPIAEGCFEYCELGQTTGQWLTVAGVIGLLLAIAVAAGSRIAALLGIAVVVPALVIMAIGLATDASIDQSSGIVAIGLAAELFLLSKTFWGSFADN